MNAPTRPQDLAGVSTEIAPYVGGQDLILHGDYFDKIDRLANIMAKAKGAVPRHLLGNPGACFAVALTAVRSNLDPYGVARKTWEGPDGTIKYEGQLVIALINNSGLLRERLRWEYFGAWEKILGRFQWRESKKKQDEHGEPKKYMVQSWNDQDEAGLGVRCFATLRGEAEPRVTELLMAQAVVRNSTLWVEDPKQQIGYLSGARWGRLHTPEAIMGIYLPDEPFEPPRDMGAADVVRPQIDPQLLADAEAAAKKGRAAYAEFWKGLKHGQRAALDEQTDHHERLKKIAADVDDARTVDNKPRGASPAPTPAPTAAPAASAPADGAAAGGQQQASADDGAFQPTYAKVHEMMKKAAGEKNEVALDIAADWIGEISDPEQRRELTQHYEAFKKEITGGQS